MFADDSVGPLGNIVPSFENPNEKVGVEDVVNIAAAEDHPGIITV